MGQDLHHWIESEMRRRGEEALKLLREIRSNDWVISDSVAEEIEELLVKEEG